MSDRTRRSDDPVAAEERTAVGAPDHDRRGVRVALALAGGGGRGLAHVGVLKVLEREEIPIDLITGTSIGAIIGALYARERDVEDVERRILDFLGSRAMRRLNLAEMERLRDVGRPSSSGSEERDPVAGDDEVDGGLFARLQRHFRRLYASHRAMSQVAMLSGDELMEALDELFEGDSFEDLAMPFAAVAVDVHSGREVIITRGSLAEGVGASSALAGIFPPVELDGRTLIDGGYVSPVPIVAAESLGANVVLAVDISLTGRDAGEFPNAVEVAMRAGEISRGALEREQLRRADVVIPARFAERHWSDFSVAREAIAGGEKATMNLLDSIRAVIDERSRRFL